MSDIVYKGSTKDIYKHDGNYIFKFSDRYSVFDWGEMPDHLNGKGASLAAFTKILYQELGSRGIKHHLIDAETNTDELLVTPFNVIRDGSSLDNQENVFIPLEVIFRLGVAKGSSLLKRFNTYRELQMFEHPMIEFTTKLERFDRPLTHEEAHKLSGLNDQEWENLLTVTKDIAIILRDRFSESGLTLWDGKIELAAGKAINGSREIILVDSIGPDELRLTRGNIQLSKEIIRQYYKTTNWYKNLDETKLKHRESFKDFISAPPKLPTEFKKAVEEMYELLPSLISENKTAELKMMKLLPVLGRYV